MKVKSLQNSKKLLGIALLLGCSSQLSAASLDTSTLYGKKVELVACAVQLTQTEPSGDMASAEENLDCQAHPTACGGRLEGDGEPLPIIKSGLTLVTKEQCKAIGGMIL